MAKPNMYLTLADPDYNERDGHYRTYLCSYYYEDAWWSVHIKAMDQEEAKHRLLAIKNTLNLDGELKISVPVTSRLAEFINRYWHALVVTAAGIMLLVAGVR